MSGAPERATLRRALCAGATLAALLAAPAAAQAAQFFVDPAGDDRASGRGPEAAWRTVARVNAAALRPGDVVRFRAGAVFADSPLAPRASGRRGAPVRYTSFGRGRAALPQGVFLRAVGWIELRRLRISGAAQGVLSSARGPGVHDVVLAASLISDVAIGVNVGNRADRAWRVAGNVITRTGDSGVIVEGAGVAVVGNTIRRTGTDPAIAYGKHGVYAKGPRAVVAANRISGFADEGVSTRFRDARIVGNRISSGPGGIGYYPDDPRAGTTVIRANRIDGVGYGVYISPTPAGRPRERFLIAGNRFGAVRGRAIDAPDDVRAGSVGLAVREVAGLLRALGRR